MVFAVCTENKRDTFYLFKIIVNYIDILALQTTDITTIVVWLIGWLGFMAYQQF